MGTTYQEVTMFSWVFIGYTAAVAGVSFFLGMALWGAFEATIEKALRKLSK